MTNSRSGRRITHVVKLVDQTKTSDDTEALDDELFLPVKANKVYTFVALMMIDCHATPDFSFHFQVPSGAVGGFKVGAWNPNIANTQFDIATDMQPSTDDTVQLIEVWGNFDTSTTAGTFGIMWAQKTSDANTSILKWGSLLTLYESL